MSYVVFWNVVIASWFVRIKSGYSIEDFDLALHAAPLCKEPVDIFDIPHQELECTRVVAGNRLSHIDEIGFITV